MGFSMDESVWILVAVLLAAGFLLIKTAFINSPEDKYKKGLKRSMKKFIDEICDSPEDEKFLRYGIKLSMKRYIAARALIVLALLFASVYSFLFLNMHLSIKLVLVAAALFLVSVPKDTFLGRPTPFSKMIESIARRHLEAKDDELMTVITQMRNIIISRGGSAISADYLLSSLLRFTKVSKPQFIQALKLIRRGDSKGAYLYFMNHFGTRLGEDFATIILKLDELPPKEFLDQLDIFQAEIKEKKKTIKSRRQEKAKLIMVTLASLELMIVILNFMYVILADTMAKMSF